MNPGREKMITEMGIGPVWKLRLNPVEQSMSVQESSSMNLSSESFNQADLSDQVDAESSLKSVTNKTNCQTCGWALTTSNAAEVGQKIRPNYLFIYECNIDGKNAQILASTAAVDQLLNSILRELQIKRGVDAYVASIVKTKPVRVVFGDRNGRDVEIFACLSCIKKEIELINPSVIISFGSGAANSLLGFEVDAAMNELRGQLLHYDEAPLIVTHELNYLLQQPKEKRGVWSDLCLAMNLIKIN